ncbi:H-NS histone family protein [Thauera sinica]|uniref:H-NS family nucleoid-associated regulatory protein n=1 Tax=Thauera sinica TaxID=2665146 RepID=A0ABW1AZ05_9RHOO|nr:H-NS histone family protein [Thauera sp. K11]ATE59063.1 transcriptional regulator [Thauera sp. K11]
MDLSSLSLTELRRLQSRVESELRRRTDTTRRNLLKKMQKMAADEGLSLDDLLETPPQPVAAKPAAQKRTRRAAAAPEKKAAPVIKYRHPEDSSKGWSGRGRKPQWAMDWVAQGKSLEELAVS